MKRIWGSSGSRQSLFALLICQEQLIHLASLVRSQHLRPGAEEAEVERAAAQVGDDEDEDDDE